MSRAVRIALIVMALCAGALSAIAGSPQPPPAADEIAVVELAEWIRARRPEVLLLDVRSTDALQRDGLPGARPATDFDASAPAADDTVILYGDRQVDETAAENLRARWKTRRILRLHGGVDAWNAEVMFPTLRADASARQQREFAPRAQLSRYFGGTPRVLSPGASVDHKRSRRGC
jgi:rhodanese-related sulfurtransferase